MTVDEVATLADSGHRARVCTFEWFEWMESVKRVGTQPARYRRNREYLVWRRAERIRDHYELDEITDMLTTTINSSAPIETVREDQFLVDFDHSPEISLR